MEEFLAVLKLNLMEELMPDEVDAQIALYEDYIHKEIAGGKTMEQVMKKLGAPEKVADMIVAHKRGEDADGSPDAEIVDGTCAGCMGGCFQDSGGCDKKERVSSMSAQEINEQVYNPEHGFHAEFKENEGWDIRLGKLKLNTWYGTFIILGVVLVVFILLSELTH